MAPRGRTPSLIGSSAGASKIVTAIKKRTCKRCHEAIPAGTPCSEVAKPGTMGHRTYCKSCFQKILAQTKQDLLQLEAKLAAVL
jgi:hypothetical protein